MCALLVVFYLCYFLFCDTFLSRFFFLTQKTAYEMRISDWSSDVSSSDRERRTAGECRRSQPGESPGNSIRDRRRAAHAVRQDQAADRDREEREQAQQRGRGRIRPQPALGGGWTLGRERARCASDPDGRGSCPSLAGPHPAEDSRPRRDLGIASDARPRRERAASADGRTGADADATDPDGVAVDRSEEH